ncbi:hypothetical protein MPSEU_000174400 [Mayamaea pseudoterrestris]|nr:hypothetical protein MPSEU_000174400 [Mayamaea pseudoterrestris]
MEDGNDNDNDIIDRAAFFRLPDDGNDEVEELLNAQVEDDDGQFEGEDWEAFIERLYHNYLKVLIQTINGDESCHVEEFKTSPEFGRLTYMEMDWKDLLPMVHLPHAREEFFAAIETKGKYTIEHVAISTRDDEEMTSGQCNECFEVLGNAISLCGKLQWIHLTIFESQSMDYPYSRMLLQIPQMRKMALTCTNTGDTYVPIMLLHTIANMRYLEDFELQDVNFATARACFQELSQTTTLRRLAWTSFYLGNDEGPIVPVSVDEANEVSRFLQSSSLDFFELQSVDLSDAAVSDIIIHSITSCFQLKEIRLSNLELGLGFNDFFQKFGCRLPAMTGLENLQFFVGWPHESEAISMEGECEVDESSALAILRGAALAPRLNELALPNCHWTQATVDALVAYLSADTPLRRLEIRGSQSDARPTALSHLRSCLERSRLEFLSCRVNDEAGVCAIAAGLALNPYIQKLFLASTRISFKSMSRICHALRSNPTLKDLECVSLKGFRYYRSSSATKAEAREVKKSTIAYQRLMEALSANVTLESISLVPYYARFFSPQEDDTLGKTIAAFVRLNEEGRVYATNTHDPDFRMNAVRFLEKVNDSLDCLYLHLHDIPMLFERR